MQILKKLSFISDHGTIELKGRVACELHAQEVLVTELLFQNTLSGMEPAEIAALLSSVVFQQVYIHYLYFWAVKSQLSCRQNVVNQNSLTH